MGYQGIESHGKFSEFVAQLIVIFANIPQSYKCVSHHWQGLRLFGEDHCDTVACQKPRKVEAQECSRHILYVQFWSKTDKLY
jgi:hypothetical protein